MDKFNGATLVGGITSPYDCCVACQTYAASNGGAPYAGSYLNTSSAYAKCLLVVGAGRCPKTQLRRSVDPGLYVSNGCNQVTEFDPPTLGSD